MLSRALETIQIAQPSVVHSPLIPSNRSDLSVMSPYEDSSSAEATVSPCALDFANRGDWEYYAVLPNTNSVFGVGRIDSKFSGVSCKKRYRHCAQLPPVIDESEEVLSQLTVEVTRWKLGMNNPYLLLRDDVDHTDASY
jgi:hypothetical protein